MLWSGLQDMNAEQAEGHKKIATESARIAAAAEAQAQIRGREDPLLPKTG